MATDGLHKEFLAANDEFASAFDKDVHGTKPMPPARQVAIVACMDARLHPEKFLGLNIGDAHVIRNAGGRASDDALRSLAISQRLLGTKEVHVVHHTDCGMLTFTNEQLSDKLRADLGVETAGQDFLPFNDLPKSVADDVATIRASQLLNPGTPVYGYVYDVTTGKLQVVPDN